MMTSSEIELKANDILINDSSTNDIFDKMLPLFDKVIKKYQRIYFAKGADDDDLYQQGMIGLYNAVLRYDKNLHKNFYFLACKCIKLNILNLVRANNAKKRLINYEALSLDKKRVWSGDSPPYTDFYSIISDSEYDPSVLLLKKENISTLRQTINELLSPLERDVLILHLEGYSYTEISSELAVSHKTVDNALTRLKRKIRKQIFM